MHVGGHVRVYTPCTCRTCACVHACAMPVHACLCMPCVDTVFRVQLMCYAYRRGQRCCVTSGCASRSSACATGCGIDQPKVGEALRQLLGAAEVVAHLTPHFVWDELVTHHRIEGVEALSEASLLGVACRLPVALGYCDGSSAWYQHGALSSSPAAASGSRRPRAGSGGGWRWPRVMDSALRGVPGLSRAARGRLRGRCQSPACATCATSKSRIIYRYFGRLHTQYVTALIPIGP